VPKIQKASNKELSITVGELARTLRQVEQALGERKVETATDGQVIALATSCRYMHSAARLVELASQSLASVNWEASSPAGSGAAHQLAGLPDRDDHEEIIDEPWTRLASRWAWVLYTAISSGYRRTSADP
jgi:hypothetical protein